MQFGRAIGRVQNRPLIETVQILRPFIVGRTPLVAVRRMYHASDMMNYLGELFECGLQIVGNLCG